MAVQAPTAEHVRAGESDKKVSASWTGALMALGSIVAAVATFFPFEKLVFFVNQHTYSVYEFTGQGSIKHTGHSLDLPFTAGNGGKIIAGAAVLVLAMAGLVLRNNGRVWVRIVALLGALAMLGMSLAYLAAPKSDAKDLNAVSHDIWIKGLVQLGAIVAIAGAALATLGCLAALFVRRHRA